MHEDPLPAVVEEAPLLLLLLLLLVARPAGHVLARVVLLAQVLVAEYLVRLGKD